jgi:hypothetical protein
VCPGAHRAEAAGSFIDPGDRRRTRHCRLFHAVATLLVLTSAGGAVGQQHIPLPPVDIGQTSFMDGLGGPGVMTRLPLTLYEASRVVGPNGHTLPGRNRLLSLSGMAHVVYSPATHLLGGYGGLEVLVPAAYIDQMTPSGKATAVGVGDVIFSVLFFQAPTTTLLGGKFYHRLDVDLVAPTGEYDRNAPVSVGSHLWSLNPYYAFTWMFTDRFETSWRFHYLANSINDEPPPGFAARTIQPGQAFHFNAAASFEVTKALRAGVAGYFLQQITDARADGRSVPHSKERVAALGPGLFAMVGTTQILANAFWECAVENRPAGSRLQLTVLHVW